MRAFSAMAALLLMACAAQEATPPVSAAPAPAPVPPIYTPTAIAPRLLPGAPVPTPAVQAQQNLERAMRSDFQAPRPSRMDPGQGQLAPDSGPFQSDVGIDPQYPAQPSSRAPIFQRR